MQSTNCKEKSNNIADWEKYNKESSDRSVL